MRSSSIVLLSGGLDSLAAFCWAKRESDLMLGLTFDYGQRSAGPEIETASNICKKYDVAHRVIELPWFGMLKSSSLLDATLPLPEIKAEDLDDLEKTLKSAKLVWVPNRNGVLINIAAAVAEVMVANWVVVGFNREEGRTFPDNSEDYLEAVCAALQYSTNKSVVVKAPMGAKTKKEIVEWCVHHDVDLSTLWSCYRGGDKMCGVCESCLRLKRALKEGGATIGEDALF